MLNYINIKLKYSANIHAESVAVREFLAADVECIERICAVGAVFEEVFFALGKFLAAFVLAKTVAAAAHAGCLNGEDKVVVILSVEERHKTLLAGKTLVDEQIFLLQLPGTTIRLMFAGVLLLLDMVGWGGLGWW